MFNKVMIFGEVDVEPFYRVTKAGKRVACLPVRSRQVCLDRKGHPKEHTEWHRVICYNDLAEIVWKEQPGHLAGVAVEGQLRTTYSRRNGRDHFRHEIVATAVRFLPITISVTEWGV